MPAMVKRAMRQNIQCVSTGKEAPTLIVEDSYGIIISLSVVVCFQEKEGPGSANDLRGQKWSRLFGQAEAVYK
jgi:hypothetical protein